jgi:glycerophosphoryl diester phosphodiesterase
VSVHPRIVAHRGFTKSETENTVGALAAAVKLGCRAVEFDVQATADGVWVMHHDPDLKRIYKADLRIAETRFAALRAVVRTLPTLADALAALTSSCRPMIEVKDTTAKHFAALAKDIASAPALDPIVIVRGSLPAAASAALSDVPIYLFEKDWDRAFARRDEEISGYDLPEEGIPDRAIRTECKRFAAAGKELAIWTVNDPKRAKLWLDAGAKWVITDRPDTI